MHITTTLNSSNDRIKGVIYGDPGAGKTTLASTFQDLEKVLFVSVEAGTAAIADKDIAMIDCTVNDKGEVLTPKARIERLKELYKYLLTKEAKEKYDIIYIDSLSEIADCVVESLQSNPDYSDPSKAYKMWGQYTKEMKHFIKLFRDLPSYHVFFTALMEFDKDESGNFKKSLSFPGKISHKAPQFFDEVFLLEVKKDKEGKEHRMLLTEATTIATAKDRSGALEKYEPCDLQIIIEKITNKTKGDK